MRRWRILLAGRGAVGIALLVCLAPLQDVRAYPPGADEPTADTLEESSSDPWRPGEYLRYGAKGLEFHPPGSATELWLGLRLQTRYDSFKGDLTSLDQLQGPEHSGVDLRRGRIKGGGALGAGWFQIYSEYDFKSDTLLDFRATATYAGWLSFRLGQWKTEFNRERFDSSGKQQFVERSLSNYWFTVDRQLGAGISPHLAPGTRADTRLWLEVLSGRGRGASFANGDALVMARMQWNPAGEQLPFSQSDLKRRRRPLPSIAVAAIAGDTPFTRFSSSGGGSLPGYKQGDYRLRQLLFETALHYRGLAWQQELHWKQVKDRSDGKKRNLWGGYAQLGSFLNEWWPAVPAPLEVVARLSFVDPDTPGRADEQWEYTLAANWYLNGHRHKFTLDYSLLDFEEGASSGSENRLRLQWELSL